ncbi:MAG: proteasome assembly chaperone family protein [Thaumarchaeota archaeon]|nr:proteasome assembly chaperone family protein [Nitrososphaerota archaeon]MCY3976258.1 proteasome assembly chaperone family protein [Nitrososphaerota archaeon]
MFQNGKINMDISFLPKLKNAKLICGLPGSGYVGKLAVDYLIDKLKATKFVDIYSSSFPPQVSIHQDGTIDLIKNSMYFCQNNKHDFILLTGDAQPVSANGEYILAEKILNTCKKLNVHSIYTLAAYITGKFVKQPKVFGTCTQLKTVDTLSNYGISKMNKGSITGMNGVIIGIAKKNQITGMCLLGETSGYVVDALASKALLEALCNLLNIDLDMSEIQKRAADTEKIIKTIESQISQTSQDQQQSMSMQSAEKNLDYIS